MQRFFFHSVFIAFSLMLIVSANGYDEDASFVGTWEGFYTLPGDPSRVYAVVMQFDGDSDGNISLTYFELGGRVLNPPPIILGHTPDLMTLRIRPGWRVYLQLEDEELIKVKSMESGSPPFPATFEKK
jgi:hypothetical protein